MVKAESPEVSGNAAKEILDSLLTPQFAQLFGQGDWHSMPDIGSHHAWAGIQDEPRFYLSSPALQAFAWHPDNGLFHRVNVLVYLNSDWKEEYGGMLELWRTAVRRHSVSRLSR